MNIKEIQELIKFVSKSGVNEVAIEQENFKITIKTNTGAGLQSGLAPGQGTGNNLYQTGFQPQALPAANYQVNAPASQPGQGQAGSASEKPAETSNLLTIKSPMIGTFYRTPGPDKPAFVSPGDEVTAGKTVCIIEAMKLFNDIESEISGRIVKVLVENASPVEYDQPLFLVEPM